MNKPNMTYSKDEDILYLAISDKKETHLSKLLLDFNEVEKASIELSPNITAELNDKRELIGIEILEASSFIRDSIMESAQAKIPEIKK